VIASSATLAERCRPHARAVLRIGNGVSADFLAACLDDAPDPEIAALPRPRLGYVGTLARWLDWDAVRAIAAGAPHGSVVLIGPGSAPRSGLPPNVRVLGPRPHAALPAALRALDLGLIPFRPSPLVDAVNPVKLYEYLAAGLPVAASPFQEMLGLDGLVWICRTAADWAGAARRAQAEPAEGPERARRRQTAAGALWSARAREFLAAIDSVVQPPRP
jgi:glycosyltransferase involved in cell wall biosynthesis